MNYLIHEAVFNEFPTLTTNRLLLRNFYITDASDLFLLRSNDDVMNYFDRPKLESIVEAQELIESVFESFKNKSGINWAIVERGTNSFMGTVGFWRMIPEHCRAEVGYAIMPDYWGKGYMTEALKAVVDFGFKELHIHSIEANCNPANTGSIKLLEKIGFKKEAYFRENYLFNNEFLDSVIYSLLEKDLY